MLPSPTPSPSNATPVPIPRRTRPSFRPPTLQRQNASLADWATRLDADLDFNASQSGTPPRSVHEDEDEGMGSSQESASSVGSGSSQGSQASGYQTPGTTQGTQSQAFGSPVHVPKRTVGGRIPGQLGTGSSALGGLRRTGGS